ncbi:MAG: CDP-diacylglycerol--serine O-phosphatidyltransferase [Bacteroidia bacterium]|nr:CDP-diacylglycerol--serine O-phosphatidyltransferase [Bacteroidia bacterium]
MQLKSNIPNTITSMNLLCGVLGVIASFNARLDLAFILMLSAAVFDFFDGMTARALGVHSELGKELDSLSDDVSFGVLPAVMLHNTMRSLGCSGLWIYIPVLVAVFTALRLAKFNIDSRQSDSFIGLPSPSAAIICGSLCSFIYSSPASAIASVCSHCWVIPLLSAVICFLLVCELPMFAFKFGKGHKADKVTSIKRIASISIAAVSAVAVLASGLSWPLILFLAFIAYIIINLF